jgi:hypothetical protein
MVLEPYDCGKLFQGELHGAKCEEEEKKAFINIYVNVVERVRNLCYDADSASAAH